MCFQGIFEPNTPAPACCDMSAGCELKTTSYGPDAHPRMGFFTDTSLCIGCKACEVACKNWNGLSANVTSLSGDSYDNTQALSGENWRPASSMPVQCSSVAPSDSVTVPLERASTPGERTAALSLHWPRTCSCNCGPDGADLAFGMPGTFPVLCAQ